MRCAAHPITESVDCLVCARTSQYRSRGRTVRVESETGAWRLQALCSGSPVEAFHPASGDRMKEARAQRVCQSCPVVRECARDTLRFPKSDWWGVRAGVVLYGSSTGAEKVAVLRNLADAQDVAS